MPLIIDRDGYLILNLGMLAISAFEIVLPSSTIMPTLTQLFQHPSQNIPLVISTSVAATIVVLSLAELAIRSPPKPKLILSPRETLLPKLTKEEQSLLAYPPDLFPGARDVTSPVSQVTWHHSTRFRYLTICFSTVQSVSMNGVPELGGRCLCYMASAPRVSRLANSPTLW